MEALWSEALPLLRAQLGERNYNTWIEPIRCTGANGEMHLEVPSRFFQEWINRHFLSVIQETLTRLAGKAIEVRLVVQTSRPVRAVPAAEPRKSTGSSARRPASPAIGALVPHYTFDTFVVGAANEVAFQAAKAVSAEPGRRFNPVFLHGGVGLGKTHLVNAVAHEILRRRARVRIGCLSGEAFMNSLITSLRQDQMNAFRDRFRRIDALILDDVQFFAGKERTQEEFFHTFNALYAADKQIVLTSDKPPPAIDGLEQRLRSRFEGGLIADIHPPTREMRLAILRAKAENQGIALPPEVAELLEKRSGPSVRELEGALNRVSATAIVRQVPISIDLAERALGPYRRMQPTVSVERIQEVVSTRFGISVADLTSHRRARQLSMARQVAMYLSRKVAAASFPTIGEKFGGRDHSTVMYAVRIVETRRAADLDVAEMLDKLEGQLQASSR
jgi:chromosomal replication initiator protein